MSRRRFCREKTEGTRRMNWVRGLILLLALLIFGVASLHWAASLSDPPKPELVARQWARGIGQLSLSPLFPPREDIEVGDIFLERSDAADRVPGLTGGDAQFWLANLGLEKIVAATYRGRFSWPSEAAEAGNGGWKLPENKNGIFAIGNEPIRLRSVSFPAVTVTSLKSSDLATSYRLEGVLGGRFGAAGGSDYTITVSIPYAQSYGLPVLDVMQKIDGYCGITVKQLDDSAALLMSMSPTRNGEAKGIPVLEVITEIVYARSIDYTLSSGYGSGGFTDVTMAGIEEIKENASRIADRLRKITEPDKPKPTTADSRHPTTADSDDTRLAAAASLDADKKVSGLKADLDRLINMVHSASAPGVSGKLISATSRSITMRQTFANPVAIGYRSLRFSIPPTARGKPVAGLPPFIPCTHAQSADLRPSPPAPQPHSPATYPVFFEWGRDWLTPEGERAIKAAVDAIQARAGSAVAVTGYTDSSGSPDRNRDLALRRAKAVLAALLEAGVGQDAIKEISGRTSADQRDGGRQVQNRRVEIEIH
jgi:OmpA family